MLDKSGVKIAKEYDTPDWSPDKAQTEMEQAITALGKNDIDGVYAANDGTAGGAIAAMKGNGVDPDQGPDDRPGRRAGRDPADPRRRAVHDGLQGVQAGGRAGRRAGLAARDGQAAAASLKITKVNNGKKDVPSVILTPVAVTKANVKSTIIKDGLYKPSELCTGASAAGCKAEGIQ